MPFLSKNFLFIIRDLTIQELVKRHFPSNVLFQEFPGPTFQEEMEMLEIYNNISTNDYILESISDNATVDGVEVYQSETTDLIRHELSSSRESYILTEKNISTFLIKFDTHSLPCWSEIRKIGDYTIRISHRFDGKEIRKQWSYYNEKTGEITEGAKSVTVSTSSIKHYSYEDVVMDKRLYRYTRFTHFKKVRRSKRKKNVRKEILLSLMYSTPVLRISL